MLARCGDRAGHGIRGGRGRGRRQTVRQACTHSWTGVHKYASLIRHVGCIRQQRFVLPLLSLFLSLPAPTPPLCFYSLFAVFQLFLLPFCMLQLPLPLLLLRFSRIFLAFNLLRCFTTLPAPHYTLPPPTTPYAGHITHVFYWPLGHAHSPAIDPSCLPLYSI